MINKSYKGPGPVPKNKNKYGEKAAKKYGIRKNLYPTDQPTQIKSELRTRNTINTYGGYGKKGDWYTTYVCHSSFQGQTNFGNIWTSAVYKNKTLAEREYFEYISSPKTSPWRDLLKVLDYSITRDNEGWITGVIVHDLKFNRYILMHFLKAYRQVYEGCNYQHFYNQIKAKADEEKIYEAFLIDSYVQGNSESSKFLFHHDHRCWKLAINKSVISRTIGGKLKACLFTESNWYTGERMGSVTFGMDNLRMSAQDATKSISKEKKTGGYIFPDHNTTSRYFSVEELESYHNRVFKMLQNKS